MSKNKFNGPDPIKIIQKRTQFVDYDEVTYPIYEISGTIKKVGERRIDITRGLRRNIENV